MQKGGYWNRCKVHKTGKSCIFIKNIILSDKICYELMIVMNQN